MLSFDSFQYSVICREQFRYPVYQHEDWTVYAPVKGEFSCTFDGKTETVATGDFYVIPPHTPFVRQVLSPLTVHFFRFTLRETPPFPLPSGRFRLRSARGEETLRLLERTLRSDETDAEFLQKHYLTDLFLQYHSERARSPQQGERVDETVQRVVEILRQSYSERCSFAEIATRVGISPSGLIKKFRKAFGIPPQRYLTELRLRHAKELLINTSASVGEISERTGFENIYYFSKVFKKETGFSPLEYRNRQTI